MVPEGGILSAWEYLDKNKIVSLILVLWTYGLMTWVVYRVFADISLINASVTAAMTAVVGIPAVAIGLFKWRRGGKADVGGG